MQAMKRWLAHMLWPVSCPICGAVAELACACCLRSLFRPQLSRCLWCGEFAPCKVHKDDRARIRSGAVYEGVMKDLILMLKYARYEAVGFRMGEALGKALTRPEADVLVPVPLHLRSPRRYNQAGAIARGLESAWDIEAWDAARWAEDVPSHAGMGAVERLSLSSAAFAFDGDVAGLRVAFVDDVCTTGATLSRLARAAQNHGAEVVGAFTAAHVPPIY